MPGKRGKSIQRFGETIEMRVLIPRDPYLKMRMDAMALQIPISDYVGQRIIELNPENGVRLAPDTLEICKTYIKANNNPRTLDQMVNELIRVAANAIGDII